MVAIVLLMAASLLLSTALSTSPRVSWWGSYERMQGTYNALCYFVIFLTLLGNLRRRAQLERLIHVVILTSLPVSIYGIVQRYGLDPLPWGGDVVTRVAANMGNAIFVAAYLIIPLFLTLERFLHTLLRMLRGASSGLTDSVLAGAYLFVAITQAICILLTQSRGPLLGLLAGLYIFGLLLLGLYRRGNKAVRWLWSAWLLLSVVGVAVLVGANLPNTPIAAFKELPYVGRLGKVFEGTGMVRLHIWDGAAEMAFSTDPLLYTDGHRDPVAAVRPIVGYGPESMYTAYARFYPPELAHYEYRYAQPDRSHNETFDTLITTGLIGLAIHVSLYTCIVYHTLKWLGLLKGRTQRRLFFGIWFGAALLAVLSFRLADGGWRFLGVALPLGQMVGLVLYIVVVSLASPIERPQHAGRVALLAALLCAILAHYIEIQFGLAVAATRTYFWVLLAVLVTLGQTDPGLWFRDSDGQAALAAHGSTASSGRKRRRRFAAAQPVGRLVAYKPWAPIVSYALLGSLVLCAPSYSLINNSQEPRGARASAIVWNSLLTRVVEGSRIAATGILAVFAGTLLLGAMLSLTQWSQSRPLTPTTDRKPPRPALAALVYVAVCMGVFLVYGLVHASGLLPAMLTPDHVASHIRLAYWWTISLTLILGTALFLESPLPRRAISRSGWASISTAILLAAGLALVIPRLSIWPVQADIYYKSGQTYENAQLLDEAEFLYGQSIALAPSQDRYYLWRGNLAPKRARAAASNQEMERAFLRGVEDLSKAHELNPLFVDPVVFLGELYRQWGELAPSSDQQASHWRSAVPYYEQSVQLSPNQTHLRNALALAYQRIGDVSAAEEQLLHSLSIDNTYVDTHIFLADVYRSMGKWKSAVDSYGDVLILDPQSIQALTGIGYSYAQLGLLGEAITANQRVLALAPNDIISLRNLALLYQQAGMLDDALANAEMVLGLSPEAEKPQIEELIRQIRSQMP